MNHTQSRTQPAPVNSYQVMQARIAELEAENANLKAFIADLQHDFNATIEHCDKYHAEGRAT